MRQHIKKATGTGELKGSFALALAVGAAVCVLAGQVPALCGGAAELVPQRIGRALPEAADGKWLAAFLTVFNRGDLEGIRRFADSDDRKAYLSSLYLEFGPLSFYEQRSGTFWLHGDVTRAWVGIDLAPAGVSGFRIAGVTRGLRPPGAPLPQRLEARELAGYLDAYLSLSARAGHFSGSVMVAKEGRTLFQGAYGLADRERRLPNRLDTRFRLASVTKMFVGLGIVQLAERGKVSLKDPISRYIPEFPRHIADQVTLRHLLTHTSGIELDDYPEYLEAVAQAPSLDGLLQAQLRYIRHLNGGNYEHFKPLGRFDYTNEGIDLLGVVLQRASGMGWKQLLRLHIFDPAGMEDTGLLPSDSPIAGLAKGYSLRDESLQGFVLGARREVDPNSPAAGAFSKTARPSGSGYSTVADMLRFANALQSNQLLSAESFRAMTSPQVEVMTVGGVKRSYGYTMDIVEQADFLSVGHSGGGPGMSAIFEIYPDLGCTVIVLSNFDRAARKVAEHIRELLAARQSQ